MHKFTLLEQIFIFSWQFCSKCFGSLCFYYIIVFIVQIIAQNPLVLQNKNAKCEVFQKELLIRA